MRWFMGLLLALALAVVGCSETAGSGGSGGSGGLGGEGGSVGLGGTPSRTAELEEFLDGHIEGQARVDEAGIAVALLGPGGVVELERTYGMANIEDSIPMTSDTVFELASVSKPFTATAIMVLYEEGQLAPEDQVSSSFPEAPPGWASMTVHHLLTHQSGLPDYISEQPPGTVEGWDNDDVLDYLLATPLQFPPGDGFDYSNSGYVMLAILVERITGESFPDFLSERVLEPLGMLDTFVPAESPPNIPAMARSYLLGSPREYSARTYGAAQVHSTLADLIRWELGIRDASVLSADTLALMATVHVEVPAAGEVSYLDDCGYGYGWAICDSFVGPLQQHGGRWGGFRNVVDRHMTEGLTTIMLSNGSYDWAFQIGPELLELYLEPRAAR